MTDDAPKTATAYAIRDHEQMRLESRDRMVALSIAREILDEYYKPESIEDMRDVRRMLQRAVEMAAYKAIQKERELHAADMVALKAFMDLRVADFMMKPRTVIAPK